MASGINVRPPVEHIFNYDNSKLAFNQEIRYVLLEKKLQTKLVMQKKNIENIINDIHLKKKTYKKYFTEKCQVVNENGKEILCQVNIKKADIKPLYVEKIKQILCVDDLFDVLFELHMQKPHLNEVGILDHFSNCIIFKPIIHMFWKSCATCNTIIKTLDIYFRLIGEITSFTVNSSDGKFTEIFMYIERNTNFVLLRPLKTVSNKELAYELLMIFTDFGPPAYLDSNTFKYSAKSYNFLNILKQLDPPFKIPSMYANSRNHKINVTTSRARKMFEEWMMKTGSSNWAIGAFVVQWLMNTRKVEDTYIRSRVVTGPIHSPFHAIFGSLPPTDKVKFKDKRQCDITKIKEKVLIDCSQCNRPIYKAFNCHSCHRLFHFTCCFRYVEQTSIGLTLINRCVSCANIYTPIYEEVILGT